MRNADRLSMVCAGVALLLFVSCDSRPAGGPPPSAVAAVPAEIDVTPRPVAMIPPGTVLADGPPPGWTNLIIKSHPRVGPESIDKVSATIAGMTSLLFTAILADVEKETRAGRAARFTLSKVAAGVGTEVDGQDMVLSSETQEELGADLGFLDRTVLSGGEAEVRRIRCVARSPTMAVLDAPNILLLQGKHRRVVLRYVLLVDPQTGRLDTLLWHLAPNEQGQHAGPVGPMQWLPANKVVDCVLHVDPGEFLLGFPTTIAFAMQRTPQGRQTLDVPDGLKSAAAQSKLTPTTARQLEEQLRGLLLRETAPP